MIRIFFVVDGPRDTATLPHIVKTILATEIEPVVRDWHDIRLNRGGGFPKKLLFAMMQARNEHDVVGLVAVVDQDKFPARSLLRELHDARKADRAKNAPLPTAVGEAAPHGEAWLLDDPHAIRVALKLDAGVEIVSIRKTKSPKEVVNNLIDLSEHVNEKRMDLLTEIAKQVNTSRCNHTKETGFAAFVDEVHTELGPLTTS